MSTQLDQAKKGDNDPGAFFEPEMLEAIALIYECDAPQYQRLRIELKQHISISALEKLIGQFVGGKRDKPSPADELVNMVNVDIELFHDENKIAYVSIDTGGHTETYPVYSRSTFEWLSMKFYKQTEKCATDLTIKTAQNALSGKARFDGELIKPFLRVANFEDSYILDLGNADWNAVKVNAEGWQIVHTPPVKFWRNENMTPLATPVRNGSLEKLWKLLNVRAKDRVFILAFIFECWRNDTMFPILELIGEQGTAKSSVQTVLRTFIDPNLVPLRAAPKSTEDLFVSASQNWLASYNNLSHLRADMQDAFCSLSTGGGIGVRKLYTNNEESVIDVSRPCIMNGIGSIATAQDLLDRVIRIELPKIKSNRPASELDQFLEDSKPEILGALLSRFSKVLRKLPEARKKPINDRMADFVMLGEAVLLSFNKTESFAEFYERKKTRAATQAIESSPAILALLKILGRRGEFHGTYARLHQSMKYQDMITGLPKSAKGVADLLKRHAPALRRIGITMIHHEQRKKDGFHVSIVRKE